MFVKFKNTTFLVLLTIFSISFLLRFINLSNYPVGFHIDEASLGYNAYSLFKTGRDDNGKSFPLYIDMFGDNRPSGYHYLTILPVVFLGLTEFATRFSGAFFGSITIFTIYFLTYSIFKEKKVSLLSAFLVGVSPWHIVLSRAGSEAVVALFFVVLGFSLILHGMIEKKNSYFPLGVLSLVISFFFYHTPRLFIPLLLLVFNAYLFPIFAKNKKIIYLSIGGFLFLSIVAFSLIFLVSGGTGRFSQVNIFSSFETAFQLKQEIQEDAIGHSPKYVSRIFHNKIINDSLFFVNNYLEYFSPGFLFVKGGLPIWYNVPRMGLVYLIELPFILIGVFNLLNKKGRVYKVPLLWLLVSPIVSALTLDDIPNVNRAIVMIPAIEIIASVGFIASIQLILKRKILFVYLCMLLLTLNIFYFLNQYFFNAKVHKPWYRNNGFSDMMKIVNKNYNFYDKIVISKFQGGIYPLVLFYSKYDPKTYQLEGSPKNKDYGGFGKFYFVPQDCPSVQTGDRTPKVKKILYIDRGDCPDDKIFLSKKYEFIYREDGTKAFRIVY